MKVLITGGCGFLAPTIASYLRKRGHDVVAKDNFVRRSSESKIERLQKHGVAFVQLPLGRRERDEIELSLWLSGLEWHARLFMKAKTIPRARVLIDADNHERFIDRSIPEVPRHIGVIQSNAIGPLERVHPEAEGIQFSEETGVADG